MNAPMSSPNPRLLGSTDAASILGVSRWATPLDVYERVVLGKWKKRTPQMQRGLDLEAQVAEGWARIAGRKLRRCEYQEQPKGRRWQRLSGDYIAEGPDEIVEVKTTEHASDWGDAPDEVPVEYLIQCQVQLEVHGLQVAHLPVLVIGKWLDVRHYVVADPELQEMAVEAMERFWTDHVEPKVPPPPQPKAPFRADWAPKDDGLNYRAIATELRGMLELRGEQVSEVFEKHTHRVCRR